ncbi:MAG: methyltransferase, partial [Acidobacteria bacterium]|nr:methyltransferase [Acidobacteriota bacterium]
MQLIFAHVPARVLMTAVQLQVFSHVAAGKRRVAEIAEAAGASERGMRMLLDALVALQLLVKDGERYRLTPLAAEYLVRGRPNYAGAMLENEGMWEGWGHLTEVVRAGSP